MKNGSRALGVVMSIGMLSGLVACKNVASFTTLASSSSQAQKSTANVSQPSGPQAPSSDLPPDAPVELPPLDGSRDCDNDHDDDQDRDDVADRDDSDLDLYADRRMIFYKNLQVAGFNYSKQLTLNSAGDECLRSMRLEQSDRVIERSRKIKLDACNGFRNARSLLAAKAPSACAVREKVVRAVSAGGVVADRRVLRQSADCLCSYERELRVGTRLTMVKKRFARMGTCEREFAQ